MRILFLTGNFPYPLDEGGKVRTYNVLRVLAKLGDVDLISICRLDSEKQYLSEIKPFCKSIKLVDKLSIGYHQKIGGLKKLQGTLKGLPWEIQDSVSDVFADEVKAADPAQYDLIVTRGAQYAYYFLEYYYPDQVMNKVIVDIDDLLPRAVEEKVSAMPSGYKKLRTLLNFRLLKKYYGRLNRVLASVVVSEQDVHYAENQLGILNTAVVPNAIEAPAADDIQPMSKDPFNILFCGSLSYRPNEEAVVFFVKQILPKIQQEIPDATLTVIGKGECPELSPQDLNGVSFEGFVPSTEPYYKKAAVVIAPILSGAGSRIKIIEAMSYGCPVVSTVLGAEGIKVTHGEDILLADTADAFSRECVELLKSAEKCAVIGAKASALFKENYSYEAFERFFTQIIKESMKEVSYV